MRRKFILSVCIPFLALLLLFLVGCGSSQNQDPREQIQNIVEPFMKSIKLPVVPDSSEYDFSFLMKVERSGIVIQGGYSTEILHTVALIAYGDGPMLFGAGEGLERIEFLAGEQCPVVCESPLAYSINPGSGLNPPPECTLSLRMSYSVGKGDCSSPCLADDELIPLPQVAGMFAGSADLDPLVADIVSLTAGVGRDEVFGNIEWTSWYEITNFVGSDKLGCGLYDVIFP